MPHESFPEPGQDPMVYWIEQLQGTMGSQPASTESGISAAPFTEGQPEFAESEAAEVPQLPVLSPEKQAEMLGDKEWYEQVVVGVKRDHTSGICVVMLQDRDSDPEMSPVERSHETFDIAPPKPNQTVRFYGTPYGDLRGIVVDGTPYFYTPKEEAEAAALAKRFEYAEEQRHKALDNELRAQDLPWPLLRRFNAIMGQETSLPAEFILTNLENAARIARYFNGDAEAIRKFNNAPDAEHLRLEDVIGLVGGTEHIETECRLAMQCVSQEGWDLRI